MPEGPVYDRKPIMQIRKSAFVQERTPPNFDLVSAYALRIELPRERFSRPLSFLTIKSVSTRQQAHVVCLTARQCSLQHIDANFVKMRIKHQNMNFSFDHCVFERDQFECHTVSARLVSFENFVSAWKTGLVLIFNLRPILDRWPEQSWFM